MNIPPKNVPCPTFPKGGERDFPTTGKRKIWDFAWLFHENRLYIHEK
jgi:hypothetical protein